MTEAIDEVFDMMEDPETGRDVKDLFDDPNYVLEIVISDSTVPEGVNAITKGVGEAASLVRMTAEPITASAEGATGKNIPSNFRTTLSHEVGHGIENYLNRNANLAPGGGTLPGFRDATRTRAVGFENRSRIRQGVLPLKRRH